MSSPRCDEARRYGPSSLSSRGGVEGLIRDIDDGVPRGGEIPRTICFLEQRPQHAPPIPKRTQIGLTVAPRQLQAGDLGDSELGDAGPRDELGLDLEPSSRKGKPIQELATKGDITVTQIGEPGSVDHIRQVEEGVVADAA